MKETVKDAFIIIIVGGIMLVGAFSLMISVIYCSVALVANLNTRTISGTYNNGIIITSDGNTWRVSNCNGTVNQGSYKVTVKFDTKGTDSVLDDEIVEIKAKHKAKQGKFKALFVSTNKQTQFL